MWHHWNLCINRMLRVLSTQTKLSKGEKSATGNEIVVSKALKNKLQNSMSPSNNRPQKSSIIYTQCTYQQAHSQDFTLGGHRSCEGPLFFSKKLTTFFCHRPQNLSSPSSGVRTFEAHRTQHCWLLIQRTVLLYWIKQALRPNKASFSVKKSTKSTIELA